MTEHVQIWTNCTIYSISHYTSTILFSVRTSHTHVPDIYPYHVPYVISQPVDNRVTAADKLQMFGLCGLLCNQENYEAGWHKGHGHNNEDGNHHICPLEPEEKGERRGEER